MQALVFGDQVDRIVQRREHSQPEQVELHQTDCGTVVFVPLQNAPILHPRPFGGTHVGDGTVADHHATGMDTQMSWHAEDLTGQVGDLRWRLVGQTAPGVLLTGAVAECPGHVADRRAASIGDDVGHLGAVVTPVTPVHVLDGLLTSIGFDVHVDVGWAVAFRGEEPLEKQLVGHRVDVGDPQRVANRRIGRTPPALTQDVVGLAEVDDVGDHQEVTGEIERLDDRQLVLDLPVGLRMLRGSAVAASGPGHRQLPQPGDLGVPVGHVERRELRGDQSQFEGAVGGQLYRIVDGVAMCGQQTGHLVAAAQMRPGNARHPAGDGIDVGACPYGCHRHREPAPSGPGEMRAGGGHRRNPDEPRHPGQCRVAVVVIGQPRGGQLDRHVVTTEPVHQVAQRHLGRRGSPAVQRPAHRPLTAAGEDQPVTAGRRRQRLPVVAQQPLLPGHHVRVGDGSR